MAYQISDGAATPHATNYSDLLDRLVTFATANGWTLHNDKRGSLGELTLKGTGLAGTDQIFVGIKTYASAGVDTYGLLFQGYTGFTDAGWLNNPGAITGRLPVLPLWNDIIPYWFFVNARRIIVVAKISTVYVAAYLGYILPYGAPGQWPYPLVIGGCNVSDASNLNFGVRYSDVSSNMSVPFIPVGDSTASPLVVRSPSGTWARLANSVGSVLAPGTGSGTTLKPANGVWPSVEALFTSQGLQWLRPNQAGDYPLLPMRLMRGDTPDALGIFDGVRAVPGFGLSAEDTITDASAAVWVAFQNTYKNDLASFFAVKEQ